MTCPENCACVLELATDKCFNNLLHNRITINFVMALKNCGVLHTVAADWLLRVVLGTDAGDTDDAVLFYI